MKTLTILDSLGLSREDYDLITEILGRTPSHTELAMFSVEWSEHCSYRRSKPYLKQFPRTGLFSPLVGDDAGGFILNDLAVIFKVESHNHPSQVEPLHGAATGVGGIIRDIVGSGARPIAILDSLRFGPVEIQKCRDIFTGVVNGIQWYGNCVGVPTVGGEIYFHSGYQNNCLVNVMCIGVAPKDKLMTSRAEPNCSVLYLGARTGRDGIGGCSVLASQELAEELSKRPTVQIGDPFFGKCLIEATLECIDKKLFVALKDMGAAGLTCTTTEMSLAGECGMVIDLYKVPKREEGMEPYEIMMSESQERMLAVVEKTKENDVINVFKKWGLEADIIGKTIPEHYVKILSNGVEVANVPVRAITNPPPINLPSQQKNKDAVSQEKIFTNIKSKVGHDTAFNYLLKLLSIPTITSKRSVWEQYDHMVQTNTMYGPQTADAAVLRLKGYNEALAATIDGNSIYTSLDPYAGAQIAVLEAARNIITTGAIPAAVTDGLNFGTPEKPEQFWSFVEVANGIRDACKELELPVISGNVSFYNESSGSNLCNRGTGCSTSSHSAFSRIAECYNENKSINRMQMVTGGNHSSDKPIPPTPIIGMVGVLRNADKAVGNSLKDIGDIIILIGDTKAEFGGSQIQLIIDGKESGSPPEVDWKIFKSLMAAFHEAVGKDIINSAHDCSEGGVGVTLAESLLSGNKGAKIEWLLEPALLFSETQSRIVVSIAKDNLPSFENIFKSHDVPFTLIGETTSQKQGLTIYWDKNRTKADTIELAKLHQAFEETLPSILAFT